MSRLDQNDSNEPKKVVQVGPTPDDILNRGSTTEPGVSIGMGPIKTAASYGDRVRKRMEATKAVKRGSGGLGHAPPLDPEKMGDLAEKMGPRPDFGEDPVPAQTRTPMEPPPGVGGGVGSGYAFNRQMAEGKVGGPISMKEARKMEAEEKAKRRTGGTDKLSPETAEQLKAVAEANEQTEEEESSFQLGGDSTSDDLEEAVRDAVAGTTNFEAASFNEQRRILMDKDRKTKIEEKLEELDISDMITKREIRQKIPIIPGKLSYTFRTFNQHENLFCMGYVYDHPGSALQAEELLNTCKLVCSLVEMNGTPLPEHRKFAGTPKEEIDNAAFEKKFQLVGSFPTQMLADMSVQAVWFEERVNKLFSLDNLKNG